jgi:hypothetical protein
VTAKSEELDDARISELGLPFFVIFLLLLAGLGMTIWRVYAQPYTADITLVVGGWNVFNLIMAGAALGVVSERGRPYDDRLPVSAGRAAGSSLDRRPDLCKLQAVVAVSGVAAAQPGHRQGQPDIPECGALPDEPRPRLLPARPGQQQGSWGGACTMRRFRYPFVFIAFCGLSTTVLAQPVPFDMSPERPAGQGEVPQMPRPRPVAPREPVPQAEEEVPAAANPPAPAPVQQPAQVEAPRQPEPPQTTAAQSSAAGDSLRRYIVPSESLALTGEYSRSAWSVYLTAEQAGAAQSINLGYQNAIVVAPEASTLSLFINNRRVGEERISAPDATRSVRWPIPAGLLRPGSNDVELVASQRHRTDCDVRSTYDLWTQIDSGETYLQFGPQFAPANSAVEAVNALGRIRKG